MSILEDHGDFQDPSESTESSRLLDGDELFALNQLKIVFPNQSLTGAGVDPIERLGRFELRRVIGEGTFGIVYEAWDPQRQVRVAIKIARAHVTLDDAKRQRFFREAGIAKKLSHACIAKVYECGDDAGQVYIVQEYCRGVTLAAWLRYSSGKPSFELIAKFMMNVAEAIDAGHDLGIIHRDLKPENILVETLADGQLRPRILDFGLAYTTEDCLRQTASSVLLGTPLYMSPEQIDGTKEEITPATDIFSLGSVLYECLVGDSPFAAKTLPEVIDKLRIGFFEPIRKARPDVPLELEAICCKCLRLEPSSRYASAAELAADLRAFCNGGRVKARLPSAWNRLRTRLRQPRHFREFAGVLIAINVLVLIWAIVNFPVAMLVLPQTKEDAYRQYVFLPVVAAIIPAHLFLLWMSWRTYIQQQTKKGAVLHLVLTISIAVCAAWSICIPQQDYPLSRFERIGALGLVASFAQLQALVVLLILQSGLWQSQKMPPAVGMAQVRSP